MSLEKFEIKNPRVLEILERFRYTYREMYRPEESNRMLVREQLGMADHYTGENEMRRIVDMGTKHGGAAENSVCHPIKPEFYDGPDINTYARRYSELDRDLKTELGLGSSALSTLYPPGGFIGWHNNANASQHNLILTWSETGDGWFRFIDPKTKELVTIPDQKGWNMKAGHFGAYGSGDVVYHAARTNCYRMTLSYVLGHDLEYWKDCIDYITNP